LRDLGEVTGARGKCDSMSNDETALEFGTSKCVCPGCGTTATHTQRGVPCSEMRCPKCDSRMVGESCAAFTAMGPSGKLDDTDTTGKWVSR